jgi:G3E family GTPase
MLVSSSKSISSSLTRHGVRGSAFPATLAFQIRELERETNRDLRLDAIVTVIDAENFTGYEDTSPTAKMQASYSDIILIVRTRPINETISLKCLEQARARRRTHSGHPDR